MACPGSNSRIMASATTSWTGSQYSIPSSSTRTSRWNVAGAWGRLMASAQVAMNRCGAEALHRLGAGSAAQSSALGQGVDPGWHQGGGDAVRGPAPAGEGL